MPFIFTLSTSLILFPVEKNLSNVVMAPKSKSQKHANFIYRSSLIVLPSSFYNITYDYNVNTIWNIFLHHFFKTGIFQNSTVSRFPFFHRNYIM